MKTNASKAAKEIKSILKKNFPNLMFSVKSMSYSMGDKVSVSYEDGPMTSDVEKLISQYQYGNFNGMEDIYEYSNVREDIPQTKYLFVERQMSDKVREEIVSYLIGYYGLETGTTYNDYIDNLRERMSTLVYREFIKRNYYK
jgi:hypothetical protein